MPPFLPLDNWIKHYKQTMIDHNMVDLINQKKTLTQMRKIAFGGILSFSHFAIFMKY